MSQLLLEKVTVASAAHTVQHLNTLRRSWAIAHGIVEGESVTLSVTVALNCLEFTTPLDFNIVEDNTNMNFDVVFGTDWSAWCADMESEFIPILPSFLNAKTNHSQLYHSIY